MARQGGEDVGEQPAHQITRPLRAQRAQAPGLPAAHRGDDAGGLGEAERAERRHGGRDGPVATEIQFRGWAGLHHGLEHFDVAGTHAAEMIEQRAREQRCVGKAEEGGDPVKLLHAFRQCVGLPVGDHLQSVLDAAQKAIGGGEVIRRVRREAPRADQQRQRAERRPLPQRRIAAAPHQLENLYQELDLADAAFAELHVVPGDARHRIGGLRQRAALVAVDAPLHGVDIGNGGEVEPVTPDERADRVEEAGAGSAIAGHGRALIIAARSQFWPMLS